MSKQVLSYSALTVGGAEGVASVAGGAGAVAAVRIHASDAAVLGQVAEPPSLA